MGLTSYVAVFPKLKMKRTDRNLLYSGAFFFLPRRKSFHTKSSHKQNHLEFFFKCMLRWNRSRVSQSVYQRWESRHQKSLVSPRGDIYFGIIFMSQAASKLLFVIDAAVTLFSGCVSMWWLGSPKQFGLQNLKKYCLHGAYQHFGNNM